MQGVGSSRPVLSSEDLWKRRQHQVQPEMGQCLGLMGIQQLMQTAGAAQPLNLLLRPCLLQSPALALMDMAAALLWTTRTPSKWCFSLSSHGTSSQPSSPMLGAVQKPFQLNHPCA